MDLEDYEEKMSGSRRGKRRIEKSEVGKIF